MFFFRQRVYPTIGKNDNTTCMQNWSLEERISLKTNAYRVQGTLVEKLIRQRRSWRGKEVE